jgi:hypothetical protein
MAANRTLPRCRLDLHRWVQGGLLAACLLIATPACRQQAKPPAASPETQPTVVVPPPQAAPAERPPTTEPAAETQPIERPRRYEVSEIGPIQPDRVFSVDQPLAILAKANPQRLARLSAILQSDTLLSIDTDNVQALRLDLTALPRKVGGRIVVHIDGQGIEITGKQGHIIYLWRSRIGEWSFGRP